MNNTLHSHLVCCFCDNEIDLDAKWCGLCREYKGIMTVEAFEDYLKVPFDCDCLPTISDPLSDLDDKVSA
jgi:hypothetical protein